MLLSDGHIVYQGPWADVLEFFESLGFQLPPRKGVTNFLHEEGSSRGRRAVDDTISIPYDKCRSRPRALAQTCVVPKMDLWKACLSRELLLMRRHCFLYNFKTCQIPLVGLLSATTFSRAILHPTSVKYGNLYLACLFYGIVFMIFNSLLELSLVLFFLHVYYRDNRFYPTWAWSLSSWIMKVPHSALESVVWAVAVYYTVGVDPSPVRFIRYVFRLFVIYQMALGIFRMLALVYFENLLYLIQMRLFGLGVCLFPSVRSSDLLARQVGSQLDERTSSLATFDAKRRWKEQTTQGETWGGTRVNAKLKTQLTVAGGARTAGPRIGRS